MQSTPPSAGDRRHDRTDEQTTDDTVAATQQDNQQPQISKFDRLVADELQDDLEPITLGWWFDDS